jgi:hypothetical protein
MLAGAWKDPSAVPDQAAVGIADLLAMGRDVRALLAANLRAPTPNSPWAVLLAFSGFSAGPTSAARAVARCARDLEGVPEADRPRAWVEALARRWREGEVFTPAGAHGNPAYTAMRGWQKLEAGRACAQAVGESDAWFPATLGPTLESALVAAAYGARVTG